MLLNVLIVSAQPLIFQSLSPPASISPLFSLSLAPYPLSLILKPCLPATSLSMSAQNASG
jgi:hypothetical protein